MSANQGWLSGHVYLNNRGSDAGDAVIGRVVAPFARFMVEKNLAERYFFIRYSDTGPHIRFRMLVPTPHHATVSSMFEKHVIEALSTELAGAPWGNMPQESVFTASPSLVWVPYEPEVTRYGGPVGIPVAEDFFHHSSEAAVAWLLSSSNLTATRFGIATALIVVLLALLTEDVEEARTMVASYKSHWARLMNARSDEVFETSYARQVSKIDVIVNDIWATVQADEALPEPAESYRNALKKIVVDLRKLTSQGLLQNGDVPIQTFEQAARMLSNSYMHMTNNRLGVWPGDEAFLGYCVERSLRCK